jgi:NADH-quinone oxidoreductase subunit L
VTLTTLAALVPALPFLASIAGMLLGRCAPGFVCPLAVLPTLAACILAVIVADRQGTGSATDAGTRLTPTGSVPIDLALHLDGFAVLIAVLVGFVATCVQVYSTSYLRDDPRYPSYAALVSLFTSAMLLVVYSGDLMVLLVGWEVMGICSYFLVGHYWETPQARSAAVKAFLVTKLGDVPFLIGIFALAADAGTFRINGILTQATSGGLHHPTFIALLLLAGVAGKSAQFPLHTWLPDAMAGPTPISALIHAATMVAAGVYFIARLLPVFLLSTAALAVIAAMAAISMAGSALAALAQDDIKRVLAYSTIGQLGYMTGALAVGNRSAAVFHLLTHGAFKALLFLGAGVLIHTAGTNSLTAMSGMNDLRRRVPDAMWTMGIGLVALAALPPFSGFFSKESVLRAAEDAAGGHVAHIPSAIGWTVLVAGLLTALLTAAYATRLILLAGGSSPARQRAHEQHNDSATPSSGTDKQVPIAPAMNIVLWLLAMPTVALGVAVGALPAWFDGTPLTPTLTTSVLGIGLALVGILTTYGAWRAGAADQPDPGRLLLGRLHRHAAHGFHLDAVYTALFVRPVLAAADLVSFFDREVVETYEHSAAATPGLLGALVRRAQSGNVQTYLSALLAGAVVLAVLVAAGA